MSKIEEGAIAGVEVKVEPTDSSATESANASMQSFESAKTADESHEKTNEGTARLLAAPKPELSNDEEKGYSADSDEEDDFRPTRRHRYPRRSRGSAISTGSMRMAWTEELHQKFVDAVSKLGDNVVPTDILRLMKVPRLTRGHIASHLQKYRHKLPKEAQRPAPPKPTPKQKIRPPKKGKAKKKQNQKNAKKLLGRSHAALLSPLPEPAPKPTAQSVAAPLPVLPAKAESTPESTSSAAIEPARSSSAAGALHEPIDARSHTSEDGGVTISWMDSLYPQRASKKRAREQIALIQRERLPKAKRPKILANARAPISAPVVRPTRSAKPFRVVKREPKAKSVHPQVEYALQPKPESPPTRHHHPLRIVLTHSKVSTSAVIPPTPLDFISVPTTDLALPDSISTANSKVVAPYSQSDGLLGAYTTASAAPVVDSVPQFSYTLQLPDTAPWPESARSQYYTTSPEEAEYISTSQTSSTPEGPAGSAELTSPESWDGELLVYNETFQAPHAGSGEYYYVPQTSAAPLPTPSGAGTPMDVQYGYPLSPDVQLYAYTGPQQFDQFQAPLYYQPAPHYQLPIFQPSYVPRDSEVPRSVPYQQW